MQPEVRHPRGLFLAHALRQLTCIVRQGVVATALATALATLACISPVWSAPLPPGSGIVNVRDFGAQGDGKTDDTKAILSAIAAARVDQGKAFWPARSVYFPSGTYLVSDTLNNRSSDGRYGNAMSLVGSSAQSARIKLADAAPGFERASQTKAVLFASSRLLDGTPTSGGKDYLGKGEGNDAYGNYVEDLTIDVGEHNPGAIGIDFLASNVGAIRHVRVIGHKESGRIGISLDRKWPGPLLVSDVTIEGFAIGLSVSQPEYHVTLQDLRLNGQSEVALRNDGNSLSMRNVTIDTPGLAIQNLGAGGLIVADRISLRLRDRSSRWIDNRGYITLKNTTWASTPPALAGLPAAADGAYFGSERLPGYSAGWRLAPVAAPAPASPSVETWANVARFGARTDSGEDASAAIAAAFRSGASVVYFPSGRYAISAPIEVPASVQRIVGMQSAITITAARANGFSRETGMVRVSTGGGPLTVEALTLDNSERGSQVGVEHAGSRSLVLRDLVTAGVSMVRAPRGGRLFLENVCCGNLRVAGSEGVWASQFNTEGGDTRILNEGSPLSILGLKVEQNTTVVENLRGAETEILGGLIYQVNPPKMQKPAFVNSSQARLTLSYTEEAYIAGSAYLEHVIHAHADGSNSVVQAEQLPRRGAMARLMPGMSILPESRINDKPSLQPFEAKP